MPNVMAERILGNMLTNVNINFISPLGSFGEIAEKTCVLHGKKKFVYSL